MKKILLLIVYIVSLSAFAQQDPLFSQYQFNQLPINPAYAGVNQVTSFDLQYRSQWGGIEGAPSTIMVSGNSSFVDNKVGLGFCLINDQLGINTNTDFNISYSYQLDLNLNTRLYFGLQSGLMSFQYDFDKLTLEDPTDEDFVNADDRFTKFNVGAGLFLHHEQYYVGFSIPRLLKIKEDIRENTGERYNQHFYITAGWIWEQSIGLKFKPYTIFRFTEGAKASSDIGISVLFANVLWGGVFTRNFNTAGISAFLNLDNGLRLGYSGEIQSGDAPDAGFNTHEVSLGIDLELFTNQVVSKRNY